MILLQITLIASVLLHVGDGGQGGRPTVFQLTIFGLIVSLVLSYSVPTIGRLTGQLRHWMVAFLIVSIVSVMLNLFNTSQTYALLSNIATDDSFARVIILSIFALVACGTAFWTGVLMQGDPRAIQRVLAIIVGAASINGVAVLVAWLSQTGGVFGRYNFELPLYSSYGLSSTVSYTGLLLVFPLWKRQGAQFTRILLIFAVPILLGSSVVILSRQQMATLFLALILHTVVSIRGAKLSMSRLTLVVLVLVGASLFVKYSVGFAEFKDLYTQLTDDSESSIAGREIVIRSSIAIFREHPVIGVGYGFWSFYNNSMFAVVGRQAVLVATPHNGLASLISEFGAVGSIIFLGLNLIALLLCWRRTREASTPFTREFANVTFTLWFVYTVSQAFSNSLILPPAVEASSVQYAFIAWLLVGICAGMEARKVPPVRRSGTIPSSKWLAKANSYR